METVQYMLICNTRYIAHMDFLDQNTLKKLELGAEMLNKKAPRTDWQSSIHDLYFAVTGHEIQFEEENNMYQDQNHNSVVLWDISGQG